MNLNQNGSPQTDHNLKLEDYEDSFGDSEQNLSVFKTNQPNQNQNPNPLPPT